MCSSTYRDQAFLSSWQSYAFATTSTYSNTWWKTSLDTKIKRAKQRETNPEQEGKKVVVVRGRESKRARQRKKKRKEKEEVEVWEHLSSTLGLIIWGAGPALSEVTSHTRSHSTGGGDEWVTRPGAASAGQLKGKWRRGFACKHNAVTDSWFSPEKTTYRRGQQLSFSHAAESDSG